MVLKVLITGAIEWTKEQKEEIENLGHEVVYIQDERTPLLDQQIDPSSIEAVICNGLFLYNDIKSMKSLKYIQLTSAGYDRAPIEYIKNKDIEIHNARNVYNIPMAEYVLGCILQKYKLFDSFMENQKQRIWRKNREIKEIYGKYVTIFGCGNVGSTCAKYLKMLGCEVTGIDPYVKQSIDFNWVYDMSSAETKLKKADIIIVTMPLTNDTYHYFDFKKFDLLKENSIFINISRGAVVDTEALINVLKYKNINVFLDVFENEPLDTEDELWKQKNVYVTPHNSFVGENNRNRLQNVIVNNLKLREN